MKLNQRGINGRTRHIINNWYKCSSSSVLWDGQHSPPFQIHQGVRQGGILSPFLYCLFVDELLDTLTQSGHGAVISGLYSGAPMYADDLVLIASSQAELQAMLDIVAAYATKWRYQLNPEKSVVMVYGEISRSRASRKWTLGVTEITECDEQLHLGVLRTVHSTSIHRTNRSCSAGRSAFFALNAVGSRFGCLHPLTSFRLYQAISLPILLYGSELWTLTKTELTMLERVHRKILWTIQGLPVRCNSSSLQALMGTQSINAHIQRRKLSFINSISCMDVNSLPRGILAARAGSAPPWECCLLLLEYS